MKVTNAADKLMRAKAIPTVQHLSNHISIFEFKWC